MEQIGQHYLTIEDAASRLGVSSATVRRRLRDGTIAHVKVGTFVRIRASDLESAVIVLDVTNPDRLREQLVEAGHLVHVPEEWLISERSRHEGQPHAFVALKPMHVGGGDGERHVHVGDILAADEGAAIDKMLLRHEVAELPLDRGVLALVLSLQARIDQLERQPTEG